MKVINNYTDRSLLKRLSLMLFVALAGICNVMAESKIYVDPFTIKPGEEKEIAVNFDNGDNIAALQANFTLPEGLSFVSYRNTNRIKRGVNTLEVIPQANGAYMILLTPLKDRVIEGNGPLTYLTIKADEDFTAKSEILFDEIHLADVDTDQEGGRIDLDPFTVSVSPNVGNMAVNEQNFSIKKNGTHKIDVILNTTVSVCAVEGRITLPAGLTIEKDEYGDEIFTYADDFPMDAYVVYEPSTEKFVLIGDTPEDDAFNGLLFSFNVVASDELAETSDIVLTDFIVSSPKEGEQYDVAYKMDDVVTINVTNSYLADYVPAMETADGLQTKLDEAIATIAETAPDVKDTEEITSAEADIQQQITDLKTAIQTAYDNETLGAEKETVLAPATDIEAAIDQLLEDAAAAQKAYEDEQAKIAANEAANTRLTEEIDALQTKLNEAKATIDEECSDVADDFADARIAIQQKIDDLSNEVYKAYNAVELTEESNIDTEKAEIEADIEKLLADAAAAQEEHDKTTGIGGIAADGAAAASEVYTLSGCKLGTAVKGSVNIIKTSDGSVKKVFIK